MTVFYQWFLLRRQLTGCPMPATLWRSVPSPVYGSHGISHWKGLQSSHGDIHLTKYRHSEHVYRHMNAHVDKHIWYPKRTVRTRGHTPAVIIGVLLLFVIWAQDLLVLLWEGRVCLAWQRATSTTMWLWSDEWGDERNCTGKIQQYQRQ